jgi:uncharacterized protein
MAGGASGPSALPCCGGFGDDRSQGWTATGAVIIPPRHEAGKMTTGPHPQLEVIDREECLRLLAGDEIGRLAVIAGNTPVVLPVNYALDGETVVFRSDPGTKVERGPRARASFEVDCFDRERRTGWSVVATGRLEEVTRYDAATFDRVQQLAVDPWAAGDKAHWMRLIPDRVTGRRVVSRSRP